MFELADIHCHALSSVDDGAESSAMMKRMIDIAYASGTKTLCFTPHFKTYEFRNEKDVQAYNSLVDTSFEKAVSYAKEKYPDMKLYIGNEIMYHNEIFDSLSANECRTLGGGSYILVEFRPSASSSDIENAISRILRKGFKPIIAHIERYVAFREKFELVSELKHMGAMMQVNAKSIGKFRFSSTARFVNKLLKKRLIDIVASDAHDDTHFIPDLSKSKAYISKHFGESYAKKIFSANPIAILNNENFY